MKKKKFRRGNSREPENTSQPRVHLSSSASWLGSWFHCTSLKSQYSAYWSHYSAMLARISHERCLSRVHSTTTWISTSTCSNQDVKSARSRWQLWRNHFMVRHYMNMQNRLDSQMSVWHHLVELLQTHICRRWRTISMLAIILSLQFCHSQLIQTHWNAQKWQKRISRKNCIRWI